MVLPIVLSSILPHHRSSGGGPVCKPSHLWVCRQSGRINGMPVRQRPALSRIVESATCSQEGCIELLIVGAAISITFADLDGVPTTFIGNPVPDMATAGDCKQP